MVIEHGKAADGDREGLGQFPQPILDPLFAVGVTFTQQKSASDTPGDAVIPSRNRRIDQVSAGHGHSGVSQ
jgi:hypothetical protein